MLGGIFEQNKIKEKLLLFDKKISQPDFWKNQSTNIQNWDQYFDYDPYFNRIPPGFENK